MMTFLEPKITVILPIYNAMPFLEDAIKSLINQTYKNFQVLCINNNSMDNSGEYLKTITDKRFKYYELKGTSLVKALNFGLKLANTEYIARMDADDISHPQRFEKQIEFLQSHKNIDIIGTQGRYIGITSKKSMRIILPKSHNQIIKSMLESKHAIIHASIILRKESIKNYFYNETYFPCEDFELFLRLRNNIRFANLDEELYYFRISDKSVLSKRIRESITKYYTISNLYSQNKKNKISFYSNLDILSVVVYRKGLHLYLNQNSIVGSVYFLLAIFINPLRLFNFIQKRFF